MNDSGSIESVGSIPLEDIQKVRWLERVRTSDTFRDATTDGLQQDAARTVDAYFNLERHDVYDHHRLESRYNHSVERAEANQVVLQQLYRSAAAMARFVQEMAHGCNDPEELLRYSEIPVELKSLNGTMSELHTHSETKSPSIVLDPEPSQSELWQARVLGEEGLRQASRRTSLAHMMGLLLLNLSSTPKLQIHAMSYQSYSSERSKGQHIFAQNFASEFVAGPPKTGSIKAQLDHLQTQQVDLGTIGRVLAYRNNAFVSVGLGSTGLKKPIHWSQEFGPYLYSESSAEGLRQTAGEPQSSPDEIPNPRTYVAVVGPNRAKRIYYLP